MMQNDPHNPPGNPHAPSSPPAPNWQNPSPPPMYAPPPMAGGYQTIKPYESGHTRALLTSIFLGGGILLSLIGIISALMQIDLLTRALSGQGITSAEADANDAREMLIAVVQILNYIITVIFFLMWFHRAHRNLPALGAQGLEYSPGWAVGGFFIPFLNLVRPFQVAKEIWKASTTEEGLTDATNWQYASVSPLLGLWWGAWLLGNILERVVTSFSKGAKELEDLIFLTRLDIAVSLFSIVAAILAIVVVLKIDARQTAKHRLLLAASPPPPQWAPPPPPQWQPPSPSQP